MLIYILFYFLFRNISLQPVDASPILNITANSTTFHPLLLLSVDAASDGSTANCSCNHRSTMDIVWGCMSTIFLSPKEESWKILWRRLKTIYWTLVAPELVMIWALQQFAGAHREWTMKHAHFLQMGGFQYRDGFRTTVLYPRQFHTLLQKGEIAFPNISIEDIADKSKSDGLSKIILVTQVFWFVTQCIARLLQGLALAQLEVATLAIISCTFMLSVIWWDKPFDIRQPVFLDKIVDRTVNHSPDSTNNATETDRAATKLLFKIPASISVNNTAVFRSPMIINEGNGNEHTGIELSQSRHRSECSKWSEVPQTDTDDDTSATNKQSDISIKHGSFWTIANQVEPLSTVLSILTAIKDRVARAFREDGNVLFTLIQIVFIWTIFDPTDELLGDHKEKTKRTRISTYFVADFTDKDKNGNKSEDGDEVQEKTKSLILHTVFLSSTVVLGVVHCIAWNSDFPSTAEKTLWHTSSILTAMVPLLDAALGSFGIMCDKLADSVYKDKDWQHVCLKIVTAIAMGALLIGVLFYVMARLYLLLEAFLSLRALPPSAFKIVEWTIVFPHI
ncbi:hypothetical protein BDQ17DRAFT_1407261 [Cyathus striatus]|nr:hypothetical protein BDQ17DRAFT_1407261 [Cyathus striatus]